MCERRVQLMAVGAHFHVVEIYLSAMWAFDNLACDFYAATRANGCFVTDLMSALRAFYNSHNIFIMLSSEC